MLTAGEFCNRDVVIAERAEPVTEIARRMRDHHVGSVVVVEERREGRVPVGILTDRDIVVSLVAIDPARVAVACVDELLVGPLVSAQTDDDLYDVLMRMRGYGIRRLPVVDAAGVLQGLIAFDDLVEHVAEQLSKLVALLSREGAREHELKPPLSRSPSAARYQ